LPIITISLSDSEYQKLKEKALQSGYSTVTEFIIDIIDRYMEEEAPKPSEQAPQQAQPDLSEIRKEINNMLRKIQDLINPYTSKIDELSRKTAELAEKIEALENIVKAIQTGEKVAPPEGIAEKRKTALDYLKIDGYVLQKDLKWLRKPEAFFAKLKREGAIVVEGEKGYIAIDREFYEGLVKELEKIKTNDAKEAIQKISPKARKLFEVLLNEGLVIYDSNTKSWKLAI
jgi:outer membrane murein-binding lipoprotein Lpp